MEEASKEEEEEKLTAVPSAKKVKTIRRKKVVDSEKGTKQADGSPAAAGLETSVEQVAERLAQGCECSREKKQSSCFRGIEPEAAYQHRLDVAELTRNEHDMYLMGVTMASLPNTSETARNKERKKSQYFFQVLPGLFRPDRSLFFIHLVD